VPRRKDVEAASRGFPPPDPAWAAKVRALPPEEQVKEVAAELKRRNPGFDGPVKHEVREGVVVGLTIHTAAVADLTPVAALPHLVQLGWASPSRVSRPTDLRPLRGLRLKSLDLSGNASVADLGPLRDMPLEGLYIAGTAVYDLSPLRGMPLRFLGCERIPVADLSPLRGLPLEGIVFDYRPERGDAEVLRSMPKLVVINNRPAAEFWQAIDAQRP
jgi:hypothetical protein